MFQCFNPNAVKYVVRFSHCQTQLPILFDCIRIHVWPRQVQPFDTQKYRPYNCFHHSVELVFVCKTHDRNAREKADARPIIILDVVTFQLPFERFNFGLRVLQVARRKEMSSSVNLNKRNRLTRIRNTVYDYVIFEILSEMWNYKIVAFCPLTLFHNISVWQFPADPIEYFSLILICPLPSAMLPHTLFGAFGFLFGIPNPHASIPSTVLNIWKVIQITKISQTLTIMSVTTSLTFDWSPRSITRKTDRLFDNST